MHGIYFFIIIIFNWRIVALQCCLDVCQTAMRISHNYIYISSLLRPSPSDPPPIYPFGSSQSARLGSLSYKAAFHYLYTVVYIYQCYFFNSSHPLLPLHLWPLKMLDLFFKRLTHLYSRNKSRAMF